MGGLGVYPLVRDVELFLDLLRAQVPSLLYETYVQDNVTLEQCQALYIVGWNAAGELVGCCEMGITPFQQVATEEVCGVVRFFRYCVEYRRPLFVSNGAWERWSTYEETGKGLWKVAG